MNTSEQAETAEDSNLGPGGEYVWSVGVDEWGLAGVPHAAHIAALGRMQEYLGEHAPAAGLSMRVRPLQAPRDASEVYWLDQNGNDHGLGVTVPVPAAVQDLFEAAWQHALDTWPQE